MRARFVLEEIGGPTLATYGASMSRSGPASLVGDIFDASSTKALPAGSYSSMPPGMKHFGWVKGETILQLSTIGPWTLTYVNPADDPRAKKS